MRSIALLAFVAAAIAARTAAAVELGPPPMTQGSRAAADAFVDAVNQANYHPPMAQYHRAPSAADEAFGVLISLALPFLVASAVAGGIIGSARNAAVEGAALGLVLGPLGVLAAFRLEKRPQCSECGEYVYRVARVCPWCGFRFEPPKGRPAVRPKDQAVAPLVLADGMEVAAAAPAPCRRPLR